MTNFSKSELWNKKGLIFAPEKRFPWLQTHAQNPFPETLENDVFRIHFSSRDKKNRAHGGYFDFSISNPNTVLNVSAIPTLKPGSLGAFDDCGVMPSSIIDVNGTKFMYYTGWSKAVEVPFLFYIGLAISEDGGETYRRYSKAPIIGRTINDPYMVGAPYTIYENSEFRMWYVSATKWERLPDGSAKHYYTIKQAISDDGINWATNKHLCIDYRLDEYAIARPVVLKFDGQYEMWFTYRGGKDSYQVGRACSQDGIKWNRDDDPLGIDVSDDGWDSEMICYAHPLKYNGKHFALYNGNGYGATGIGLAQQI